MSFTNAAETDCLELFFTNAAWANVGDVGGLQPSSSAGSLYVSLHTATPDETGDQTTNECDYTSYARVAVARGAAWTVAGNNASNTSVINFPQCTGGSNTATHFGIGSAVSGAGNLFIYGALSSSLAISNGITPSIPAGDLDINLD